MRPDITDQGASAAQPASPVEGNSIPEQALSQKCLTQLVVDQLGSALQDVSLTLLFPGRPGPWERTVRELERALRGARQGLAAATDTLAAEAGLAPPSGEEVA